VLLEGREGSGGIGLDGRVLGAGRLFFVDLDGLGMSRDHLRRIFVIECWAFQLSRLLGHSQYKSPPPANVRNLLRSFDTGWLTQEPLHH
jgi:hypothetical protein